MSSALSYKGYTARVEFDAEDRLFFGRLAGIDDIVGFHGDTVAELVKAFEDAVEDYLATCEKLGHSPQKPHSGKVLLRLPPEVHARISMAAEAEGKSLNAWASDQLRRAVHA